MKSVEYYEKLLKKNEEQHKRILAAIEYAKELSTVRTCKTCKKEFIPKRLNQFYCCNKCYRDMQYILNRDETIERTKRNYRKRKALLVGKNETD